MKAIKGLFNKNKISKRAQKYLGILDRGIITKNESVHLKSILSNHALRLNLTDSEVELLSDAFLEVAPGKVKITPEHTEQGLKFFKNLIYTPTGKVRRRASEHLNNLDSDADAKTIKRVIDNFGHFELAGFEGTNYNSYRDAYSYSPVWRTVAKDGETFVYTQVCQSEAERKGIWGR